MEMSLIKRAPARPEKAFDHAIVLYTSYCNRWYQKYKVTPNIVSPTPKQVVCDYEWLRNGLKCTNAGSLEQELGKIVLNS